MDNLETWGMVWEYIKFATPPILITIVLLVIIFFGNKIMEKVLNIKKDQLELEKEKMYMTVDPDLVNKTIDDHIKAKIDKYLLDHGIIDNNGYITQETISEMIHDITKDIYLHLSDLYKTYILLVTKEVEDENTILKFIRDKVKYQVINIAAEVNPPRE